MAKGWIKGATGKKGALHRNLHVPADKPIPPAKLEAATHSVNPTIRKEAVLAATLKGFHKRRRAALYGDK